METRLFFATICCTLFGLHTSRAQTNLQVLYDFAPDRKHLTTTLEGFYNDKWGNTFFFIDHDFNSKDAKNHVYAPSGTYLEIARCLNFWRQSKFAPLSLHVEYNGGVYNGYTINNAWLVGVDFSLHSSDFQQTLNLKALYKTIAKTHQQVPVQLTVVWGLGDFFALKGLSCSGYADFWWEDHTVYPYRHGAYDYSDGRKSHVSFSSEPQLWYQVGRLFGVENLNIGGELELTYDFATGDGFWCRPCLGCKWVF